ncbi:MAG: hypothetical protein J0L76_04775 [Rhodobacterales bacterium]|nr:hypothetical protein [Rhodobacterales bacterium]
MKIDTRSALLGAIAILGLLAVSYFGYGAYMAGDSGVSVSSACADMRDNLRKGEEGLEENPNSKELIKAVSNLNNLYIQTCL